MTKELLAALDKLRGVNARSAFVAKLIMEKAGQDDVVIDMPKTANASDVVKQAAEEFETTHHRPPAILELQSATRLSYPKVWNAVRSLGIKTLGRAEFEEVKRSEARKRDQERIERQEYSRLVEWNRQKPLSALVLTKYHGENRSSMRIGKVSVDLSRRYDKVEEALPEFTQKVQAIIAKYAYEMFLKAQASRQEDVA